MPDTPTTSPAPQRPALSATSAPPLSAQTTEAVRYVIAHIAKTIDDARYSNGPCDDDEPRGYDPSSLEVATGLIAPLVARIAALEAEVAMLKEPDLFWLESNPESGGDLEYITDQILCEADLGEIVHVTAARVTTDRWFVLSWNEEDECADVVGPFLTEAEAEKAVVAPPAGGTT